MSCPPSELRERNEPKGGVGVETERSGAEVPVRWERLREREKIPGAGLFSAKQSGEIAARRRKAGCFRLSNKIPDLPEITRKQLPIGFS